ncbi:MAG: hypothetical protein HC898_04165 [Phycisphaerales bacterium]|nr:hypothetical protein [Phycisphaerales bacterium]
MKKQLFHHTILIALCLALLPAVLGAQEAEPIVNGDEAPVILIIPDADQAPPAPVEVIQMPAVSISDAALAPANSDKPGQPSEQPVNGNTLPPAAQPATSANVMPDTALETKPDSTTDAKPDATTDPLLNRLRSVCPMAWC